VKRPRPAPVKNDSKRRLELALEHLRALRKLQREGCECATQIAWAERQVAELRKMK
jgi:hypothetical protein